jgi:hypothetical protein
MVFLAKDPPDEPSHGIIRGFPGGMEGDSPGNGGRFKPFELGGCAGSVQAFEDDKIFPDLGVIFHTADILAGISSFFQQGKKRNQLVAGLLTLILKGKV